MLTDWQNFETQTDYINSMVIKLFSFQFVNSYASLYYIAFGKIHFEGCTNGDCMYDLTIQLATIFITNFFLNLLELGMPFVKSKYRMWRYRKAPMSPEQYQFNFESYDEPLDDYMEIVIGYGYVVLFGIAFPFTPLMALVLCIIELRVDAWKLCNLTRRPYPTRDCSIGIWLSVTQIMAVAGVITNVGVLIFTSDVFDFKDAGQKWTVFFIIEHALIVFKISLSSLIPDTPKVAIDGIKWGNRIASEKINGKLTDINLEREQKGLTFLSAQETTLTLDNVLA